MADPFDASDADNSNIWQNLAAFGAQTVIGANARTPQGFLEYGTGAAGPLAAGYMGAVQNARTQDQARAQLGYTKANTADVQSQVQQRQLQNMLSAMQYNRQAAVYGMPQIPTPGMGASGTPGMSGFQMGLSGNLGQGGAPSGNGPPQPAMAQGQQGMQPPVSQSQGGQSSTQQPDILSLARRAATGALPNSRGDALQLAAAADWAGLDPKISTGYRDTALKLPEGEQFGAGGATQTDPTYVQTKGRVAGAEASAQVGPHMLEKGFTGGPGGMAPVAGGPADPKYLGGVANAEGWGKAGPEAWTQAMHPESLRGPGSVYINPYFGQTVQIPNEITQVDPKTLAEMKRFVPLGLSITGNGPLTMAGQPQGNAGQTGGQPGQTPPIQYPTNPGDGTITNSAAPPGQPAGGETGFMTKAPPGQEQLIKGAAENYTMEGRKTFESAMDLKGSLEFIKRDIDQMGPEGFTAMGSAANTRNAFAKAINTASQVAGGNPLFDPNKIAAWEDFQKESTLGGMKGLAAIFGGSREAASIIHSSMGAFPQPANSYTGAKLLVNAFDEAANHEIDQRSFETNWAQQHGGNLIGANEAFAQKYPPAKYTLRAISKIQPYKISDPSQASRFLPGTQVQTPDGRTLIVPGPLSVPLLGQPQ